MSRYRSNGNKNFVWGALFGGILAGVTALLYAPKKGSKLRQDLSEKCETVKGKASELLEEVRDHAQDVVERAKDKVKDLASSAKETAQKLRRD
jgi:gas vesicle protein